MGRDQLASTPLRNSHSARSSMTLSTPVLVRSSSACSNESVKIDNPSNRMVWPRISLVIKALLALAVITMALGKARVPHTLRPSNPNLAKQAIMKGSPATCNWWDGAWIERSKVAKYRNTEETKCRSAVDNLTWVPRGDCKLPELDGLASGQLHALLERAGGPLCFVGDSLVRQIFTSTQC